MFAPNLNKMDTSQQYITQQPAERQGVLTALHKVIVENDTTVTPVVEPMMGKEMIMYKGRGMMKYALASVKNYMSLHVLPMYGSAILYNKYKALLPAANFQKGCINFKNASEISLEEIKHLIIDCSNIDLVKIREDYLASKKTKAVKKQ